MLRLMDKISPQTLRILALVVVLLAVLVFFASVVPNYLNGRLFNRISSSVAIMALIATAQTLVIITRNIDLSIGSTLGFVAFATGSLVTTNPDLGPAAPGRSTRWGWVPCSVPSTACSSPMPGCPPSS